ncbi:hypothetical protein HZA44_02305 [Candidatus Peregrinibacteria bacterium]|nr:hypothetical protein [Candidatus Peregrinibacteria bacterium]
MALATNPSLAPVASKTNIFSLPLKAKQEATAALKKRNTRIAGLKLGVAAVLLAVYSVMFLYPQMREYLDFGNKLQTAQTAIEQYKANLDDLQKKRDLHKSAYDEQFKEEQRVINSVFPEETGKLGVIRLMENFATNLNTSFPPFEFNSITFQSETKGSGYTILPFQTSIRTSRANFDRFLELVKRSGNVDPKSPDHIRLMDISNISLRYLGLDAEGKDLGVDFNVQMNAYSR